MFFGVTQGNLTGSQSHAINNHGQDTQSFLASDAIASLPLSKSDGSICTHWMGDQDFDCRSGSWSSRQFLLCFPGSKHSQSPHSIMLRTNWPWLSPHSYKLLSKTPGFQEGLQSPIGSSTFSRPPDCFDIGHSWSWWSSKVCKPDWDINLRKGREPVGSKNPRMKSAFQNVWSAKPPCLFQCVLRFYLCMKCKTKEQICSRVHEDISLRGHCHSRSSASICDETCEHGVSPGAGNLL